MHKNAIKIESYDVSISDWITILQDLTSWNSTMIIFLASSILGTLIALPQLVKEAIGSDLLSSIILLLLILLIWVIFVLFSNKIQQEHKPYRELYKKIIYGEITDPKDVLKEYKNIESKSNKKKIG